MLNNIDEQYFWLLNHILICGKDRDNRTGIKTRSIFGYQMRINIANSFPLLTTKKVHFKSIVHELLWMISGDTNVKYLNDNGVTIWNEWADENGDLGLVYGHQWRYFNGVDQLANVIQEIKDNPQSRRLIVNSWNAADIDEMALPPCHVMFQFYVDDDRLSLMLTQRSADVFLGLPFNIASYTLLVYLVADLTGLKPGELIWSGGDCHIYHNHFDQVNLQLMRDPYPLPKLKIRANSYKTIDDYKYEDIELIGYKSHPSIKAEVAV